MTCACNKQARNKRRRQKQQARNFKKYSEMSAQRVRENQNDPIIESLAVKSGLEYDTVKDLIGLKFN